MAHLLNSSFISTNPCVRRQSTISLTQPTSRRPQNVAKIREIFMPELSSTMTEGKIVSWVKSEGDKLSKGKFVIVVKSDKADMDAETLYDGYLAAIMVEEGGVSLVGSAITLLAETKVEIALVISKAKEQSSSSSSSSPTAQSSSPPAETQVPDSIHAPVPAKAAVMPVASTHPASDGGKRISGFNLDEMEISNFQFGRCGHNWVV